MSTYRHLHIMKFLTVSAYIKRKISNKQPNFIPQRIREQIELKIRKSRNEILKFLNRKQVGFLKRQNNLQTLKLD